MEKYRVLKRLICACVLLLAFAPPVTARVAVPVGKTIGLHGENVSAPERRKVLALLRAGGFTGAFENQARITLRKMGTVKAGNAPLILYVHVATFPPAYRRGAVHQTTRLLVMTDSKYLGSYTITEFPLRLRGNVLEFPKDKDFPNEDLGYTITFGPEGPPAQVHLLGEIQGFGK